MNMRYILFITAVIILITSCSDESSIFDPTYFGEGFKGITFTGENDPTPFKSDPSDWCSLPPVGIDPDSNIVIPITLTFSPAYPNPVKLGNTTTLSFTIPQSTLVYLYIINNNYKILAVLINDVLNAGSYQIQLDTEGIGATGVYRAVFETENIYCKGDIWITR